MFNSCTVIAEETREYKITNPETRRKRAEYTRLWKKKNRDYVKAYRQMYNAKRKMERIKPVSTNANELGICTKCGKAVCTGKRKVCDDCQKAHVSEYNAMYYRTHKQVSPADNGEKLCIKCGKNPCVPKRRVCKECRNAQTREYHRTHREAICARKRAQRLEAKAALLRQQLKTPVADIAAKNAQIERLENQLMELQAVPRVVDTDVKVQIKDPIKVNMEAVPKTLKDYWLAIGLLILWITTVVVGVFR